MNSAVRGGEARRILLLSALIFSVFVATNAQYVFRTPLYEDSDFAANSLQVRNAKQFRELHGNSSRWSFHHPGPAFFYVYALGEGITHDLLHIVPTPFNGQKIALYALTAFLFSAALVIIAARLSGDAGGRWFISLALIIAASHFGAVGRVFQLVPGDNGLLGSWPPFVLLAPFLCLLAAAASVASGGGQHLALLVFAGCLLLHGHVGQPLLVLPSWLAAYAGLARQTGCWPWQHFRRQHLIAAAIASVFALPLVLDVLFVRPSNLSLILQHLQTHHGDRKPLLSSILYFIQFGAYSAYPNSGEAGAFSSYDAAGMWSFVRMHWRAYGLWLGVLLLPAVISRRGKALVGEGRRFIRSFYAVLLLALVLTFVWGCVQDGPLFYYNAFFNFALYYGFAIACAALVACWCERFFARRLLRDFAPGLLAICAAGAFVVNADGFRAGAGGLRENGRLASSVNAALAADPQRGAPKFVAFEHDAWMAAYGVLLQLDRAGQPWSISADWRARFGIRQTLRARPADELSAPAWRIITPATATAMRGALDWPLFPLTNGCALATAAPIINPAGARISFSFSGNFGAYLRSGWSSAEGPWAWSEAKRALLDFRGPSTAQDVGIAVNLSPFIVPEKLLSQRVDLFFDGTLLGSSQLNAATRTTIETQVPAAVWNAQPDHQLRFEFPDAQSPLSLGMSDDVRLLGAQFFTIDFR